MAAPEYLIPDWQQRRSEEPAFLDERPAGPAVVLPFSPDAARIPNETRMAEAQRPNGFVFDGVRASGAIRAGLSKRSAALRPLPMEDVCFYVKPIGNTRLYRKADPAGKVFWKSCLVLGAFAVAVILASFVPRALLRQSGYRAEKFSRAQMQLVEVNRQLKVREGILSSLHRIGGLAAENGMTVPAPNTLAWQDRTLPPPDDEKQLALSRGEPGR
jgi:hypothetical protein